MDAKEIIGLVIFIVSVLMTVILQRVKLVRRNPTIAITFIINPGVVGCMAALAFFMHDSNYSFYFWLGSMLLMVPTVLLIGLAIPKAVFKDVTPPKTNADAMPRQDDEQT